MLQQDDHTRQSVHRHKQRFPEFPTYTKRNHNNHTNTFKNPIDKLIKQNTQTHEIRKFNTLKADLHRIN